MNKKEIRDLILKQSTGFGIGGTTINVEELTDQFQQAMIDQINEIRSRHNIPINSTTDIILKRIEDTLKEKSNG